MQDVDYVVLNGTEIIEGKIDFKDIIDRLRPDIFVLNSNDDAITQKKELCDSLEIELKLVQRIVPIELEPTSTTRIINKISFVYQAPLRIDFAGGWTDIPFIMNGKKGYVSNVAIAPLIEYKNGKFNFSGYPRGCGLSTSTSAKLLEMMSAKNYNVDGKSLPNISEDLFSLENRELNWAIGRQDQYSIVYGGFNCFEFSDNFAIPIISGIQQDILDKFHSQLLLLYSGISRNAQSIVKQVYNNFRKEKGQRAIKNLAKYAKEFAQALQSQDFIECAKLMEYNFNAQKELASKTSNNEIEKIYNFAKSNGAMGGKICGAGGGGAFIFFCEDPSYLLKRIKKEFVNCFEIDFKFEYRNIKKLNSI
jgi:galactokinase/mevalonate kinase-like predicted kinase